MVIRMYVLICLMLSVVYGGRDRTGAGRRGKTVIMFIYITWRKGPGGSR